MRLPTLTLGAALLLGACGEPFVNAPVACPVRSYIFSQTTSPTRAGQPCDFGVYPFSIAYSPRVDTFRDPDAKDYWLARGRVTVTAAGTSVLLCPGSGQSICTGGVSELTTVISDSGALSYQGVFITENLALQPGGMAKSSGPLVFENYGPGNSCIVEHTAEFICQAPVR